MPMTASASSSASDRNRGNGASSAARISSPSHNASARIAAAASNFNAEVCRRWSNDSKRARSANHNSSATLIQTPIEVANASPTCASGFISTIFNATLTATPTASAFTGVAVSPRDRNVAESTRASTNGTSPTV